MLGELNEIQMHNLLMSQASGRLGCSVDNQPYIVPVIYAYDGKYIYGQLTEGKKLEMLRKNNKVCFFFFFLMNMQNWQGVIVYGTFEELKGKDLKEAKDIFYSQNYPLSTGNKVHPHEHGVNVKLDDSNRVKPVMYRIKIKNKSGRFEKQ